MLGVLPEIVEMRAADDDVRNPLLRVVDLEILGVDRIEQRHRFERRCCFRVTQLDPVEGLLALDLLEPQPRVVRLLGGA